VHPLSFARVTNVGRSDNQFEGEIAHAGALSPAELRAIAQRSCAVLQEDRSSDS
jgi:hypothetical protein